MKKLFASVALVGICALLVFLSFSKNLAEHKARELELAWRTSEARLLQVEAELQTAKQQLLQFTNQAAKAHNSTTTNSLPGGLSTPGSVTYAATSGSLVRIEGTSTIHDWQAEGTLMGGTLSLGQVFDISTAPQTNTPFPASATIFIPVRSIKSVEPNGKPYSDKMDEVMYEKLNTGLFNRIIFSLNQLTMNQRSNGTNALDCVAVGDLAVAGATNHISMPVQIAQAKADRLQVTGLVKVKMTDFGIQPPEPVGLGIKTGDEVTLKFLWLLQPTGNVASRK